MNKSIRLLWLMLLSLSVQFAQATESIEIKTIEDLISAGELEAQLVIETKPPLYQKAPIEISVEVGTDRWFKRGTKVHDFIVAETLVRPTSSFAFNDSRRRDGDTWSFQSWSFYLYAQKTGRLQTPPLTVFISVDTEMHGVIEGEITLEAPELEIQAPPGSEALDYWVASTDFTVDESWEGELEEYQVGDAVTRIRRFTIDSAPAMSIPDSPEIKLDGLQVYQAPAKVNDKTVRGSIQGIREEKTVITFNTAGSFTIPDDQLFWLDLDTNSVETIELPGREFEVSGLSLGSQISLKPSFKENKWLFLYTGIGILALALSFFVIRKLIQLPSFISIRNRLDLAKQKRQLKAGYMRAASEQNTQQCLNLLYERMSDYSQWQLEMACAHDQELSRVSAALLAHAYGVGKAPEVNELKMLWKVTDVTKNNMDCEVSLQLNPESTRIPSVNN